jgi:hypothetical protein
MILPLIILPFWFRLVRVVKVLRKSLYSFFGDGADLGRWDLYDLL